MHPTLESLARKGKIALAVAGLMYTTGCANQLMYHVDGINPYTNTPVGSGNGTLPKSYDERLADLRLERTKEMADIYLAEKGKGKTHEEANIVTRKYMIDKYGPPETWKP